MTSPMLTPHGRLSRDDAYGLMDMGLDALMPAAAARRDAAHGLVVTYSRKVFIPLTQLCRDVCHYCTFAQAPRKGEAPYLTPRRGARDRPGGRPRKLQGSALYAWGQARAALRRGTRCARARWATRAPWPTSPHVARAVYDETGLLPHLNPGLLDARRFSCAAPSVAVRRASCSRAASERLCERGGPHFGSPDKKPAARLETIRLAGEADVPFTTGILIGIGETRSERIDALLALRDLHERYGHIQEIIIQNFRPKAGHPDGQCAGAHARRAFVDHRRRAPDLRSVHEHPGATESYAPARCAHSCDAGINDWGGVSPVTPDHVNPEAPWPHLDALAAGDAGCGQGAYSNGWRCTPRMLATSTAGWIRPSARRCCIAWTAMAFHAPTAGRPAPKKTPRKPTCN